MKYITALFLCLSFATLLGSDLRFGDSSRIEAKRECPNVWSDPYSSDPYLKTSRVRAQESRPIAIIMYDLRLGGAQRALVNMLNHPQFPSSKVDFCYITRNGPLFGILNKNISLIPLHKATKKKYNMVISYLEGLDPSKWVHKMHGKKKVQWIHTDLKTCLWKPPFFYANKCRGIDTFVCVSEATRKSFIEVHPDLSSKTQVIFNIVNEEVIRKEALQPIQDLPQEKGILNIVSIGRLAPEKGLDRAISVCKRLLNEGYRFRWYIVGEGPRKEALELAIQQNNLKGVFVLLGGRTNPYPYFKAADIFVLPSLLEGRSVVISEAQILGLPILATDVGGIREQIVPNENGSIVANSEEAIYEGLKFLIEHPEVREKYRNALKNFKYDNSESITRLQRLLP